MDTDKRAISTRWIGKELVSLTGSNMPASSAIIVNSWSHPISIRFKGLRGRVIPSSTICGLVLYASLEQWIFINQGSNPSLITFYVRVLLSPLSLFGRSGSRYVVMTYILVKRGEEDEEKNY